VTTSGPGTDRLLLDSKTLLISESSPQSIRKTLELLMANPEKAQELGAAAQRLYLESFQPAVIVTRLRDVVSDLETAEEVVNYQAVVPGRVQSGL